MSERLNLIDITPTDNELSRNDAERFRAENQPRGHEALEDEKRMKELEARRAELLERLHALGEDVEPVTATKAEDKVEKSNPTTLAEKLKNDKIFKAKVTSSVAIALGSIGILVGSIALVKSNQNAAVPPVATAPPVTITYEQPAPEAPEEVEDTVDNTEYELSGIIDGYGEDGMWESDTKTGPYAFADFEKVVELHDGDVKEAVKDVTRNQVESLADFVSGLDDSLRPAGYENLSMAEVDEKIEGLSDVEYDNLKKEIDDLIDQSEVKEITLNGKYDNAYMGVRDGDKVMGSKEALENDVEINHEAMQLVKCTTNEKGSKAYEFTFEKDGHTYTVLVKEACTQVVEKEGSNPKRYAGIPEVTEKTIKGGGPVIVPKPDPSPSPHPSPSPTPHPSPSPTPHPSPSPTPTPKPWGKSGDPHTGDDYLPTTVINPAVPDISDINDGNQGYVDDNHATPGSPSDNNNNNNNDDRLSGGEDQSDGNMAGENPYHNDDSQGQEQDNSGNQAQESAQENNDVGGDNNSDKEEESRVAEGNF